MKKRMLLVMPMPPPMHGSNVVNQYVASIELGDLVNSRILPIRYAREISDIGSFRFSKAVQFLVIWVKLLINLVMFRPHYVYFVPAVIGISYLRDFALAILFKAFGTEIIYHLHGKGIREQACNRLYRHAYKLFFNRTNIIHLSPLLFKDLDGLTEGCRIYSLANGIEYEDFSKSRTDDSSTPNILYLSNFVSSKGMLDFMNACGLLVKAGFRFNLFLAGMPSRDISVSFIQDRIKELGLQGFIKHLGPAYGDEKKALLRKADIFVLPTCKDCFPLVLLEALSYGIAIVTTDEGAIAEIIENGKTGLIAQKRDPQDLADKIAHLINSPELRISLGRNGRSKFLNHYTLDKFRQEFRRIIAEIVQNKN
ncbi:glycosyltransferase family 4 protein [Syntrophus buswellii]|uniref:glycosyltransferase family 4 protein n=1 Tax=Syntrophus buswellii TaxID=43774 RepID=UPI0038D3E598